MTFFITFGQDSPFRDGWVEIEAESIDAARKIAFDVLGQKWSMIYTEANFSPGYFPQGKFGRTLK